MLHNDFYITQDTEITLSEQNIICSKEKTKHFSYIDGLLQDCGNFIANTLELLVLYWASNI